MEIRARTAEDLDELVEVATRVHAVDGYPMFLPGGDVGRFLTRPEAAAAWVAVVDDRVVGHVSLHDTSSPPVTDLVASRFPDEPAVYVARLFVDPTMRRRGAGRRLVAHAVQAARVMGRSPFLDVVETPASAAAHRLYEQDGWLEIGRVRIEAGGQAIEELVYRAPAG